MTNDPSQGFIRLPLTYAYDFLRQQGLDSEADLIQNTRDKFLSYDSTLRRAKVVKLLESKALLQEFISRHWPAGSSEDGQRQLQFLRRLYERWTSAHGEQGMAEGETEAPEEVALANSEENEFAYESALRDYLVKNLHLIESGLRLYDNGSGISGREFSVDPSNRRVDILAVDLSGTPVVIELKVSRGHERTVGQALYYRTRVKQMLGMNRARIVIIAREISKELRAACDSLADVQLFEYRLSFELVQI